jgi:hypothetical protein
MKAYIFMVRSRLRSSRWLSLLVAWHVLRLRKLFRSEFSIPREKKGPKIDLVIPTISKDFDLVKTVIEAAMENITSEINKVFVVSRKDQFIMDFCSANGYVFVDELSVLGYGKNEITYVANGDNRSGWLFQQLLKLSGERFVEMENYFIIDSDTVLLSPQSVIEDGRFVFFQNEEWHEPYFKAFAWLFGYEAPTKLSYTSHMMIFNTKKLTLMKKELEARHGMSWDKAYAGTASETEASCVSDYDTYANWVLRNFPNEVCDRIFYNRGLNRKHFGTLEELRARYGKKYSSVSFHSYIS